MDPNELINLVTQRQAEMGAPSHEETIAAVQAEEELREERLAIHETRVEDQPTRG